MNALTEDEVKEIEEFKKTFSEKFDRKISVIIEAKESNPMPLSELEEFFIPIVTERFGKNVSLKSKLRYRELVDYKIIFSVLAKQLGYTTTAIGKYLKKDHTTVVHYNKTFRDLMLTSDAFKNKYEEVKKMIYG